YRTGRVLGRGSFSIVKEIINIQTGSRYACKIVNKDDMQGRENMVLNEIRILKLLSGGSKNIITLYDYFESSRNVYICVDLCTGGHLFTRILKKGHYPESDAAQLVRSILTDLVYIHSVDVVHRDLKPENLLFRTSAEDADLIITDFGLARVVSNGAGKESDLLTEICGTQRYMAPEIFKKTGHGKPVDVWAIGVITYLLLSGNSPFAREDSDVEEKAITSGEYKFEPLADWAHVSKTAQEFIMCCLTMDPNERPTAEKCLKHPVGEFEWLLFLSLNTLIRSSGQNPCLLRLYVLSLS
ncbi:kinase-like domain-containing protein, partial [Lentinula detonsa]